MELQFFLIKKTHIVRLFIQKDMELQLKEISGEVRAVGTKGLATGLTV